MERTYTLTVESCEGRPHLVAEFRDVPEDKIQRAFNFANKNFREVKAVCDQTGEVILSAYAGAEWFEPVYNYGEAIDYLTPICYNPEF